MHPTPEFIVAPNSVAAKRPLSDFVYQGMTILAMLLLLASLWVF